MLRLEEIRESKTFANQIGILMDYISPFKQMWPFYWLKAAAVRDPKASTWRLCYFALIGRWSDTKPIREIYDPGNAIVAISQLIDAAKAWEILTSLEEYGSIELPANITASAVPDFMSPTFYCQEGIPFSIPKVIAEVAESADWRYLWAQENTAWRTDRVKWFFDDVSNERDYNEWLSEERIKQTAKPDLDKRGLQDFQAFTSTRLGLDLSQAGITCSIRDFLFHFDLPLALRVERGIPDRSANKLPLTIYCRRPLMLETLKMSTGDIWLPAAEYFSIENVSSVEVGWSVGDVTVPYTCGKIWFAAENLDKALSYDIPIPTPEDQVTEVLGSMYHLNSLDEGKRRWKQHLLGSKGTDFEIALLNAIARFGIPILFAGRVQHEGQEKDQAGGPGTRGYDLVALDYAKQRAVLISVKGYSNNPSQEDCQKLLVAVEAVQEILQQWYVTGIIACHATNNKLGLARKRNDLRVWSQEDLEMLFQADKREVIEFLLWTPPDVPRVLEQTFMNIKGY